eukprot:6069898-Amphidinium_carterae.1
MALDHVISGRESYESTPEHFARHAMPVTLRLAANANVDMLLHATYCMLCHERQLTNQVLAHVFYRAVDAPHQAW